MLPDNFAAPASLPIIVRMIDGTVYETNGTSWTEPPTIPAVGESLFAVVFQGGLKIASFNPTEVLMIYFKDVVTEEELWRVSWFPAPRIAMAVL